MDSFVAQIRSSFGVLKQRKPVQSGDVREDGFAEEMTLCWALNDEYRTWLVGGWG